MTDAARTEERLASTSIVAARLLWLKSQLVEQDPFGAEPRISSCGDFPVTALVVDEKSRALGVVCDEVRTVHAVRLRSGDGRKDDKETPEQESHSPSFL
jgi:hypothetical protein